MGQKGEYMNVPSAESILASYVTYKELYANDNYTNQYQILAEFINYIISTENLYNFSIPQLKQRISEVFGFNLPLAVIRTALKRSSYIECVPGSVQYGVNRKNIQVDEVFNQYRQTAKKESGELVESIYQFAIGEGFVSVPKSELTSALIAYLLDESNGGAYQAIISKFIIENSENEAIVKQLNAVREGSILYLGLNCNITETGSITSDLVLFLDTEILFDIYGYNGEVYRNTAFDLISLVRDANKKKRRIHLRYFRETKNEISNFFQAASEIVKTGTYLKENVAMKSIVNGCKDVSDVAEREADFFHNLQYSYGIVCDGYDNYYSQDNYEYNLEGMNKPNSDEDEEKSLRYLSHINKLRKGVTYYDYTKCGYLFVTQTWKTIQLSNQIVDKLISSDDETEGLRPCGLATNMTFLTNILWYKLKKGFGARSYPKNIDSVIKAKIVLSNFISQNVSEAYKRYKNQYDDGLISDDQMAARLLCLREKAQKPEDINASNVADNLRFDESYLQRFEEEREQQRIELEEKKALIYQLSESKNDEIKKIQDDLNRTSLNLEASLKKEEVHKNTIEKQEHVIQEKEKEIKKKDDLLSEYIEKEKQSKARIELLKKGGRFVAEIIIRVVILALIIWVSYLFTKSIKADKANTVAIIVTIIGIVIGACDTVKNVYKKIFDKQD